MALTTVSFSLYNNIARGLTRMNEDARSYRIRGSTDGKESTVMHTVIMRRKQELGRKTEEVFEVTRAAPLPSTVGDRGEQPHQIRISSNRHTRRGFRLGATASCMLHWRSMPLRHADRQPRSQESFADTISFEPAPNPCLARPI